MITEILRYPKNAIMADNLLAKIEIIDIFSSAFFRLIRKRKYWVEKDVFFEVIEVKSGIHPEYNELEVTCSCGNTFKTKSTNKIIKVEICSNCHPFFTGKQRLIDTAGRVERFRRKYAKLDKKEQ